MTDAQYLQALQHERRCELAAIDLVVNVPLVNSHTDLGKLGHKVDIAHVSPRHIGAFVLDELISEQTRCQKGVPKLCS